MAEGPPDHVPIARIPFALPSVVRFAIAGAANSALGFGVLLLALWFGLPDVAANLTGFAAGLVLGFIVNRQWTFGQEGAVRLSEVARYIMGFGLAWSINLAVVLLGIRAGYAGSPLIHLAGIAAYSVAFYFISRWFVFVRHD